MTWYFDSILVYLVAKLPEFDCLKLVCQEDVLGFDIDVEDSASVKVLDSEHQLGKNA